MGHDLHAADAGVDFPGLARTAAVAGLARMDTVRNIVGRWSSGKSRDARLFAVLRPLGVAAEIPVRPAVARWRRAFLVRVLSGSISVADPELRGLPAFRFYS